MMKMNKLKLIKAIVITLLFLYATFSYVVQHEKVHQRIFEYMGGCKSKIIYSFPTAYTIPKTNCTLTDDMMMLHAMNEIFGYNIQALIVNIWSAFAVFIIIFGLRSDKSQKTQSKSSS